MKLVLMAANAVAMMAAALVLWLVADLPAALTAHLVLALGIMPLILAAMAYFVPVLTRSDAAPRAVDTLPLAAWVGSLAMVASRSGATAISAPMADALAVAGSLSAAAAAAALISWTLARARRSLGAPHPGLAWYLAALGFLLAALLVVPALLLMPALYPGLRVVHLHANLLGFVGLTALGTLQVLLPTAAGRWDQHASGRLARDLKFAVAGAALLALGTATSTALAAVGAVLFAWPVLRMGKRWLTGYADQIVRLHGAATSLGLSCVGLLGLLAAGVAHGFGHLGTSGAAAGFVLAFLGPLVSGAAMQLLPVWLRPGRQDAWHETLRYDLGRLAGVHATLLVAGGLSVACGHPQGLWLAAAGLALLLGNTARALLAPR